MYSASNQRVRQAFTGETAKIENDKEDILKRLIRIWKWFCGGWYINEVIETIITPFILNLIGLSCSRFYFDCKNTPESICSFYNHVKRTINII